MRTTLRRACFGVISLLLLWFMCVHRTVCFDYCPCCESYTVTSRVTVVGLTIEECEVSRDSLLQAIARDLGVACCHVQREHECLRREWGLLICAAPCRDGTLVASIDAAEYSDEMRSRASAMANDHDLASEFYERAILSKDADYIADFLCRLQGDSARN